MSRPVAVFDWYHFFNDLGLFTRSCTLYKYKPSHFGCLSMSWLNMDITIHTNHQDPSRKITESYMREGTKHIPVLPFDVAEADRVFRGEPASDANDVYLTVTNVEGEDIHSELDWFSRKYLAKDDMNAPYLNNIVPEFYAYRLSYDNTSLTASETDTLKALPEKLIGSWFADHMKHFYNKLRIRQREYNITSFSLNTSIHFECRVVLKAHDEDSGRYENVELRRTWHSHIKNFDDVLRSKLQETHTPGDLAAYV
jgi:hypothetical protein